MPKPAPARRVGRPRKAYTPILLRLSPERLAEVEAHAAAAGITRTAAIEELIARGYRAV